MPYDWVEPEVFVTYKGVTVYHVYKNDYVQEGRRAHWFTTDIGGSEDGDYCFDVRALDTYRPGISYKTIIRDAIDNGLLDVPE